MSESKIKHGTIQDLKFDPKNANRGTERGNQALEESLQRYGAGRSVLVDKNGIIIAGNKTVAKAGEIGMEDVVFVPTSGDKLVVVVREDLDLETDPEARAIAVADNRVGELDLSWDAAVLLDSVKDIDNLDPFFSQAEIDEMTLASIANENEEEKSGNNDPDEIPDVQSEAISFPGSLWTLGSHRLLCGDSTNKDDVVRLMNGKKSGLMNTDPPYGVDYSKTKDGIPRPGFKDHQEKWGDIINDDLEGKNLQIFLEKVFSNILPYLDRAAWYLWHAHLTQGYFAAAAAAAAANVLLHRQIIWKKPGFVLTRSGMYHWAHEPCFYGWVKGQQPKWLGNKSQTSVWEIGRDTDHGKMHQTQKPVELFKIPILNHLEVGEICYEPFCGSGSQIVAAEQLSRRCYAMELDPRYVDVIIRRWQEFTGQSAVLDGDGRTFNEIEATVRE